MLTSAAIIGAERMCLPVLFKEISLDLNLNLVSIGTIWGLDPLAGMMVGLPAGLLADRYGLKRTLGVLGVLCGIVGALRGLSVDFLTMSVTMFTFGMVVAAIPSCMPKVTATWFSGRHLALVNALLNVAWSIGAMVALFFSATWLSPWLGGWERVLFLFGAPAAIVGVLWLVTGREPEKKDSVVSHSGVQYRQALSRVIHFKEVWIIGLTAATYWGSNMGLTGYLPLYLRDIGWTPVSADSLMTVVTGISMLGVIPMVLLSDKLRSRRVVLIFSLALHAISLGILPLIDGMPVCVSLVIVGFLRSGAGPLFNVMILELEGIGSTYSGTANGLMNTIGMVGAFSGPPLGNALAEFGAGYPFYFWAFLSAAGLIVLVFFKEKRGTIGAPV